MKMITVRVVDDNNNNNYGKKTTVMELAVDPKYIVAENILVQYTNEEGDTLHFIRILPMMIMMTMQAIPKEQRRRMKIQPVIMMMIQV